MTLASEMANYVNGVLISIFLLYLFEKVITTTTVKSHDDIIIDIEDEVVIASGGQAKVLKGMIFKFEC